MSPTKLPNTIPCLWPSPERGNKTAASEVSAMCSAMPVGINWVSPGLSSSGSRRQAQRSMPTAPTKTKNSSGNSLPMRGSRILTCMLGMVSLGYEGNESAREVRLTSEGPLDAAVRPHEGEGVIVADDAHPGLPHPVGGDEVESLRHQFLEGAGKQVFGLGREGHGVRTRRGGGHGGDAVVGVSLLVRVVCAVLFFLLCGCGGRVV